MKILKIISVHNHHITCEASDGNIYELDAMPLIEKHSKFKGIDKLKDPDFFETVKIGIMGELYWENCININGEHWNYDISPEFISHNAQIITQVH